MEFCSAVIFQSLEGLSMGIRLLWGLGLRAFRLRVAGRRRFDWQMHWGGPRTDEELGAVTQPCEDSASAPGPRAASCSLWPGSWSQEHPSTFPQSWAWPCFAESEGY